MEWLRVAAAIVRLDNQARGTRARPGSSFWNLLSVLRAFRSRRQDGHGYRLSRCSLRRMRRVRRQVRKMRDSRSLERMRPAQRRSEGRLCEVSSRPGAAAEPHCWAGGPQIPSRQPDGAKLEDATSDPTSG